MTQHQNECAFVMDWPEPDLRFLRSECMPAPDIPSATIFGRKWADWISTAAEAKSAPPDYAIAALLTVAGALIDNQSSPKRRCPASGILKTYLT